MFSSQWAAFSYLKTLLCQLILEPESIVFLLLLLHPPHSSPPPCPKQRLVHLIYQAKCLGHTQKPSYSSYFLLIIILLLFPILLLFLLLFLSRAVAVVLLVPFQVVAS